MRTLLVTSTFAAALLAVPSIAMAQTKGSSPFCLKKQQSQTLNCAYRTMAQCEQAKVSQSDLCSPRARTQRQKKGATTSGAAPMTKNGATSKNPQGPKGRASTPEPEPKTEAPATRN